VFENRRHSTLDVDSLKTEAVRMLPGNPGGLLAVSRNEVILHKLAAPGAADDYIHVVDSNGNSLRSFAPAPEAVSDPWDRVRIIGYAGSDRLWIAPINAYRLELWSLDGELLRIIERSAGFFEPWEGYNRSEPRYERPRPRIRSMFSGDDGILWVSILVAAEEWEAETRTGPIARNSASGTALYWDAVVEAIDVGTGSVLARARVGPRLSAFRAPTGFVTQVKAVGDIDVIEVLKPRLRR
jgi:hypothetical protein